MSKRPRRDRFEGASWSYAPAASMQASQQADLRKPKSRALLSPIEAVQPQFGTLQGLFGFGLPIPIGCGRFFARPRRRIYALGRSDAITAY